MANDPEVRSASFSKATILWEDHFKWFRKQLNDPKSIFFIVTYENIPIGQIRFEATNEEATISVSLKKEYRGRNVGSTVIGISTQEIFDSTKINKIHSYVKVDNKASMTAFLKANFKNIRLSEIKGYKAFHLIKERK